MPSCVVAKSKICTTCGLLMLEESLASRPKRSMRAPSLARAADMNFTATVVANPRWLASQTSPMPPTPSKLTSSMFSATRSPALNSVSGARAANARGSSGEGWAQGSLRAGSSEAGRWAWELCDWQGRSQGACPTRRLVRRAVTPRRERPLLVGCFGKRDSRGRLQDGPSRSERRS